jgi:UDP-hydrolysing UDP-N-acetyl-D-glucosamine 2-epimerase
MHSETLQGTSSDQFIAPVLNALSELQDTNIIFTLGNADAGGKQINDAIKKFASEYPASMRVVTSLGQVRYLSALKASDIVLGNSSSGIVEAPSAGTVVVNIGDRQRGRLRSKNIIDVSNTDSEIRSALKKGLSDEMQNEASHVHSPFGKPGASEKIFDVIAHYELEGILHKEFFDLNDKNLNEGAE